MRVAIVGRWIFARPLHVLRSRGAVRTYYCICRRGSTSRRKATEVVGFNRFGINNGGLVHYCHVLPSSNSSRFLFVLMDHVEFSPVHKNMTDRYVSRRPVRANYARGYYILNSAHNFSVFWHLGVVRHVYNNITQHRPWDRLDHGMPVIIR